MQVKATDADMFDTLTYAIVSPNRQFFDVDSTDGTLVAHRGLDVGQYILNISVTDGKFTTFSDVEVFVDLVSEEMLENGVGIRFAKLAPEEFFLQHKRSFIKALKNELSVRSRDITIISIQPAEQPFRQKREANSNKPGDLDVLFAIARGDDVYHKSSLLQRKLKPSVLRRMSESLRLHIVGLVPDICTQDTCKEGVCREKLVMDDMDVMSVVTPSASFISPVHYRQHDCYCTEGFGGILT